MAFRDVRLAAALYTGLVARASTLHPGVAAVDPGQGMPGFLYGAVVDARDKGGAIRDVVAMEHDTKFAEDSSNPLELASDTIRIRTQDGDTRIIEATAAGAKFPTGAVGGYQGWKGWQQSTYMGAYWEDGGVIDYRNADDYRSVIGLLDYVCHLRCGDEDGSGVVEAIPFGH